MKPRLEKGRTEHNTWKDMRKEAKSSVEQAVVSMCECRPQVPQHMTLRAQRSQQ